MEIRLSAQVRHDFATRPQFGPMFSPDRDFGSDKIETVKSNRPVHTRDPELGNDLPPAAVKRSRCRVVVAVSAECATCVHPAQIEGSPESGRQARPHPLSLRIGCACPVVGAKNCIKGQASARHGRAQFCLSPAQQAVERFGLRAQILTCTTVRSKLMPGHLLCGGGAARRALGSYSSHFPIPSAAQKRAAASSSP